MRLRSALHSTPRLGILVLAVAASLPIWAFQRPFFLSVATLTLIFMAASIAWNIISGFGGQTSFGHSIFFGVGAYATVILQTTYAGNAWVGLALGAVLSVAVAGMLGWLTLRLRGFYFAMATFTLTLVFAILATHFSGFTGGVGGLTLPLHGDSPGDLSFANKAWYFYLALTLAAVAFAVAYLVLGSRMGLQLRAIRVDEDAARASGVLSYRVKLTALGLSAALTSVAGAIYAQYVGFIDPESVFGAVVATQIAVLAFVGGAGRLWGPVLGAALLVPLQNLLNEQFAAYPAGFNLVIYALVILVILWIEPRGLMSLRLPRRRRGTRRGGHSILTIEADDPAGGASVDRTGDATAKDTGVERAGDS